MGSSPQALSAPVAYVESLFKDERLPYELGWKPSVVPITLASLGQFVFELYGAQPKGTQLPLGLEVLTVGAYREFVTTQAALASKQLPKPPTS